MLPTNEYLDVPDDTNQFNRTGVGESVVVLAGVFCGDEPPPIPPGVFHA